MSAQDLADAAIAGDAGTVGHLLAEDPELVREYTEEGWTALHVAANAQIAAMLIDAGADINARNRHKFAGPGNSPLSAATYQERVDVVRLLIERGADVNQGDNASFTPLHLAAALGYPDIARILLEGGADPNRRSAANAGHNLGSKTPLELLSESDRKRDDGTVVPSEADAEMAALLGEHGAAS
jgi:ankyrin repeat protein